MANLVGFSAWRVPLPGWWSARRLVCFAARSERSLHRSRLCAYAKLYTRCCLAIQVNRKINSDKVLHRLTELFVRPGSPDHIRSDNSSEFTAQSVRTWLARIGVKTLYLEPGSPWENGYNESFNSKLRDEILNTEIFYTLREAKVLIERWRHHYNTVRLHSSLGCRPTAPKNHLAQTSTGRPTQLMGYARPVNSHQTLT